MLFRIFDEIEQANIRYCLLRDGWDRAALLDASDVDLLVEEGQLPALSRVLRRSGFVRLRRWGYAPHHFFVAYDRSADRWVKLDVVTRLAYGPPGDQVRTALGKRVLENRRKVGRLFIPSAADELMTLLLHAVLDKQRFSAGRCERISALRSEIADGREMSNLLNKAGFGEMAWRDVEAAIESENWENLLALGPDIARRLGRSRLALLVSRTRSRALRKLNRVAWIFRPEAIAVALLAPDGAGKSTLASGLARTFFSPVMPVYMGLWQHAPGHARRARLPGLGWVSRLLTQWKRYLAARHHRTRGRLVVFDRYSYDALLNVAPTGLIRRWKQRLIAYACPAPHLIVVLDAPGDVLFARKAEHSIEGLERQRQGYLRLASKFPQCMVVDATQGEDLVRREVLEGIWHCQAGLGRSRKP